MISSHVSGLSLVISSHVLGLSLVVSSHVSGLWWLVTMCQVSGDYRYVSGLV